MSLSSGFYALGFHKKSICKQKKTARDKHTTKTRFSRALVSWSGSVVMGGANDDDDSADAVTLEALVKVSSARFFLSFFSILFQFCNELSLAAAFFFFALTDAH